MKTLTGFFIAFFICTFFVEDVFSQSRSERREERRAERQERREWRQQAREHRRNPLEFRDKIEGYEETISGQNEEISDLKSELSKQNQLIDSLKQETSPERIAERARVSPAAVPEGLSFKVQVGAYQKFNINHYFESGIFIRPEVKNELNKYVIGYFTDLDEAGHFKKDMQKLGVRDAWVVPYFDGERISDEQAEQLLGKPFREKN